MTAVEDQRALLMRRARAHCSPSGVFDGARRRPGKYTDIQFDKSGSIVGARLTEYLLEKARVIKLGLQERRSALASPSHQCHHALATAAF